MYVQCFHVLLGNFQFRSPHTGRFNHVTNFAHLDPASNLRALWYTLLEWPPRPTTFQRWENQKRLKIYHIHWFSKIDCRDFSPHVGVVLLFQPTLPESVVSVFRRLVDRKFVVICGHVTHLWWNLFAIFSISSAVCDHQTRNGFFFLKRPFVLRLLYIFPEIAAFKKIFIYNKVFAYDRNLMV